MTSANQMPPRATTVVDPATGADEVFARVVALLRRSEHEWGPGVRHLDSGGLRVDLWAQECFLDGEQLQLSPTEYALLTFLMTHPRQALSTHTIVREVWGWFTSDGKNVLRIFVNRLRRKLHDDFRNPQYIASVRGTGYRFIRNVRRGVGRGSARTAATSNGQPSTSSTCSTEPATPTAWPGSAALGPGCSSWWPRTCRRARWQA